jgi:hypothetical protein
LWCESPAVRDRQGWSTAALPGQATEPGKFDTPPRCREAADNKAKAIVDDLRASKSNHAVSTAVAALS